MPLRKPIRRKLHPVEKIEEQVAQFSSYETLTKPSYTKPYTPVLIILLLIASFFLGMLITKVQDLEKNKTMQSQQVQAVTSPPGISASPTPGAKVNVSIGHLPIKGGQNAKVTIIEFADFQCPFCQRFFKDTEPSIIKDYVDGGKAKFAFRHYAFLDRPPTQESTWAAEASECANDQGRFWDFHDYLYNNQGTENSGTFTKEKLEGFATALGLDTSQFTSCLESDKHAKDVTSDLAAGQTAGVTGTPAIIINGQLIVGAQPYSAFKTVIDAELAKK